MSADDVYDWIMENLFGWFSVGALIILMLSLVFIVGFMSYGLVSMLLEAMK